MPHRELFYTSVFQQLRYAARRMIAVPRNRSFPHPVSKVTPPKHVRNAEIRARHRAGESLSALAEVFGISEQRVHQIVQGRRK
jgi:Mor family transcriptional regulator